MSTISQETKHSSTITSESKSHPPGLFDVALFDVSLFDDVGGAEVITNETKHSSSISNETKH